MGDIYRRIVSYNPQKIRTVFSGQSDYPPSVFVLCDQESERPNLTREAVAQLISCTQIREIQLVATPVRYTVKAANHHCEATRDLV